MAKPTKTFEYRRARWWLGNGQTLEPLVRQVWAKYGTHDARTVTLSDGRSTCGLRAKDYQGKGFAIHCARYTDRQGVGTIQTAPAASQVRIGEQLPPHDKNFLNSDLMALIKGDHVICMNCGRNAGSLRIYLQELFRKASFPDETREFELIRIAAPDTVALIEKLGVKRIDLQMGIAEATAEGLIDEAGGDGFWRKALADVLLAITERDETVEQIRRAEKGTMIVSINVPKGDLKAAKKGLDQLSRDIVEDEEAENYTIVLGNGQTIKPNEVSVRKRVKLEGAANSVDVSDTWSEMETYMGELMKSRQLEA